MTSTPSQLTRVLGLEVGLALQRRWQVVETERQLPLEGGVFLAEGWKSPERTLTHQLLDGRVAARDGVRPAGLRTLHWGRRTLRGGGGARWKGWDCRRLVWRRKCGHFYSRPLYCRQPEHLKAQIALQNVRGVREHLRHAPSYLTTFLLVRQLVVPLAAAALLAAGRVGAEWSLAHKWSATGIEGSCHAALLLPALFPLQAGGKGTANSMAQSLSLVESKESKYKTLSKGHTRFKWKSHFQKFIKDDWDLCAPIEIILWCLYYYDLWLWFYVTLQMMFTYKMHNKDWVETQISTSKLLNVKLSSIQVINEFLKLFVVCACKHHILITVTGNRPYSGFKKNNFAIRRIQKENRIV